MTLTLPMELRRVDAEARSITGVVAPYDEVTYLVSNPGGERIKRSAFNRSITQRGTRIPLCVNHDHSHAVGMSTRWEETTEGLEGTFEFRNSTRADEVLADVKEGYLTGLSVGFLPVDTARASDGVMEVREARLFEVSLVLIGAYDSARVLAARQAEGLSALLTPFQNPPALPVPFIPPWA
jgi:HK97 family phage prohead protease